MLAGRTRLYSRSLERDRGTRERSRQHGRRPARRGRTRCRRPIRGAGARTPSQASPSRARTRCCGRGCCRDASAAGRSPGRSRCGRRDAAAARTIAADAAATTRRTPRRDAAGTATAVARSRSIRIAERGPLQSPRRSSGAVQGRGLHARMDVDGRGADRSVRSAAAEAHVCRAPLGDAHDRGSRGPLHQPVVRAHVDVDEVRTARSARSQQRARQAGSAAVAHVRSLSTRGPRARRCRDCVSRGWLPQHVDVDPRRAAQAPRMDAAPAERSRGCGRGRTRARWSATAGPRGPHGSRRDRRPRAAHVRRVPTATERAGRSGDVLQGPRLHADGDDRSRVAATGLGRRGRAGRERARAAEADVRGLP